MDDLATVELTVAKWRPGDRHAVRLVAVIESVEEDRTATSRLPLNANGRRTRHRERYDDGRRSRGH